MHVCRLGQAARLERERLAGDGDDMAQGLRGRADEDRDMALGKIFCAGLARRVERAAAVEVGGGQALRAQPPGQQDRAIEEGGVLRLSGSGSVVSRIGRAISTRSPDFHTRDTSTKRAGPGGIGTGWPLTRTVSAPGATQAG